MILSLTSYISTDLRKMLFVLFTFSRKDDHLSRLVAMGNVCTVDHIVVYSLREGNLDKFGYLARSLFV